MLKIKFRSIGLEEKIVDSSGRRISGCSLIHRSDESLYKSRSSDFPSYSREFNPTFKCYLVSISTHDLISLFVDREDIAEENFSTT